MPSVVLAIQSLWFFIVNRYCEETVGFVRIAVVPVEQVGVHTLGIRYAIIPYCLPTKDKSQRCTSLVRGQQTPSVVLTTNATLPHRANVEGNRRAGIVHDDRFFRDIRGVWPGPEKIEAVSRRILNPESGISVGTQFL